MIAPTNELNALRPRQNGRCFTEDHFKCISWMKIYGFRSIFHWSLFLRVELTIFHDGVIKWKPFPRYWLFVRGIHRSPMNSPHKGQWCRALMFSLICAWINGWVNNGKAVDLRCHRTHYDVTVMAALVQIMAWRRLGDKQLSDPMMVRFLTHICVTRPQWVKFDSH